MWTLDFETEPIEGNTSYRPPRPVGLALKVDGNQSSYHTDWETMQRIWGNWVEHSRSPGLFHHAKFDIAVGTFWFGTPVPDRLRIHDTMYDIFLYDPYSTNLKLKPNVVKILGWDLPERDELELWIRANVPGCNNKDWGAGIHLAPVELTGPYACADVDMTYALHQEIHPKIIEMGMQEGYQREQKLMPVLYRSEKKGVRCDRNKLETDLVTYEQALLNVEYDLAVKVKNKCVDWSKGTQVADALDAAGLIGEWVLTPTGKRSTAKGNLEAAVSNVDVFNLLRYRASLATCLQTFMRPWSVDSAADGRLHTTWNQVRTDLGGGSVGTRTGRLSGSRPYLLNISNEFDQVIPPGLPDLPFCRQYLLPEVDHVWLKRDFSAQEIRIAAHYEDGVLLEAFIANPGLDPHALAMEIIKAQSMLELRRKDVKIIAFRIIYGSGIPGLANGLGVSYTRAANTLDAYFRAFPGIADLSKDTKRRGYAGKPIRTWGGRVYYTEPKKLIKGRMRSFEYKLLNYLIQGGAADQTKQSIIEWDEVKPPEDVFLAAVHDDLNISAPDDIRWQHSMDVLRRVMDKDRFDCPFQSEGFVGPNWYDLKECA